MKNNRDLTYYCFNRHCSNAVFQQEPLHLHLPFTLDVIAGDHFCNACGQQLISIIDIEIKQALLYQPAQQEY